MNITLRALLFVIGGTVGVSAFGQIRQVAKNIHLPASAIIRDSAQTAVNVSQNRVSVQQLNATTYYLTATLQADSEASMAVIDLPVTIDKPAGMSMEQIKKQFHWLPNIKSAPGQVISQHVFRSPCIIQTMPDMSVVVIPDVQKMGDNQPAPYYLDLQYTDSTVILHYGMRHTEVHGHVYYQPNNKPFRLNNRLEISFYLLTLPTSDPLAVLQKTNAFLWQRFAANYTKSPLPQTIPFQQYADTGFGMALDRYWVKVNDSLGGITLSTLQKDSVYGGRYFKNDLWFQSWFNNMRTAYGLYSWGKQADKPEWQERAEMVVNLLLKAPRDQGWFATVYAPVEGKWLASGSPGFVRQESYYVADNCWTAYWLLRFTKDLKEIPQADAWLLAFGEALLRVQHADGSFPAGVRAQDIAADTTLDHSASSAMATWYLEELLLAGKVPAPSVTRYRECIRRSLNFLRRDILPDQRFEDFESFFSCSRKPMHYYDSATALYNQNTMSMQWCAEAFLQGYKLFGQRQELRDAEYCLNILSLYQQVWNPPFISFYAFGGFGAQNTDGEWSDARQAQFAESYYRFFKVTKRRECLERAIAACRASFTLMVLPENRSMAPNNYLGTAFNGEQWSGNMAENYGHHGKDERSYQSGFHWGTGSALTTAAIFQRELGELFGKPIIDVK